MEGENRTLELTKEPRFKLYFVDLAGSERAGQYALNGLQLREGANINRSLFTLGRVVAALARGRCEHVPYRDSTLTRLLQDAITGASARAFMVATLNPAHAAESLSTLRYAQNYSSLQSAFAARIPQLHLAVRDAQRWLMKAQSEFAAASALISEASGIEFTEGSLREDLVRPNRDAKRAFARHYDGTNS